MLYIQRKDGKVTGYATGPQPEWGGETLPENHPEIVAFESDGVKETRNATVTAKIAALEVGQARAVRDWLLSNDQEVKDAAKVKLLDIETKVATQRARMEK